MRRYRWTLYEGDRIIDSGELEAKNEREAMGLVFLDHADSVRSDGNYRVVVGDTSMSSEGRDFTRSAAAAGWGKDQKENQLARGRYLFDDPVLDRILEPTEKAADAMRDLGVAASDCAEKFDNQQTFGGYDSDRQREFDTLLAPCGPTPPCSDGSQNHDMNDETAHPQTGEIHAQCRHCGLIDPVGTGRILRDPYGGPSMNPLPRGTDRIVGRALNSGEKGDVIEVTLNPEYGGGRYTSEAGGRVAVNEGVRIGASGMVYPPPRNELPYVQEIVNGVAKKVARSMIQSAISKIVGKANLQCDKCGNNFEVELPGTGPWTGVPCPHCAVTYTFERNFS